MAGKEVAIGKRLRISQAQQYMLLAVLGAAIVLGVAIALVINFFKQITFNAKVIGEKDNSISLYSNVIKNVGICQSPSGQVYSEEELRKCNPDSIEISEISGTLRSTILENLAANKALNAVPREDEKACMNPETSKNFTYAELNKIYSTARGDEELAKASDLIKSCSALRVIPDAVPAFRNEEALLSSLNKIFILSNWEPESLSPSGSATEEGGEETGVKSIALNLVVEADSEVTLKVLSNIERSVREFNIEQAKIEWGGAGGLTFNGQATAYYVDKAELIEVNKTIKGEEGK